MARPRTTKSQESEEIIPFQIKEGPVPVRIRAGAGTHTSHVDGKFLGKGVFTVDKVRIGPGSKSGWGHLSTGEGWVGLDFVEILK